MRESLLRRSVPPGAIHIMLASLTETSFKQYNTCLKKWYLFCSKYNIDLYQPSIPKIIFFFTIMFEAGAQYGTLNSCRSALSLILGRQISEDDRIKRFFKGIFRLRPPLPKYNLTWDTSLVIETLAKWIPNETLSLEMITKKLVTLLALVTAHRVQTFSKIDVKNIKITRNEINIMIPDFIKTSSAIAKQPLLVLPYFQDRPEICPAKLLVDYLNVTSNLRDSNNHSSLFISTKKPHGKVSAQTISRWIKNTLEVSGIDVTIFTAHSTRHASTSKAHKLGVNLDLIRKTAGWSGTSTTFARFYNKVITSDSNDHIFARNVLLSK
jgi:hypothetical protein